MKLKKKNNMLHVFLDVYHVSKKGFIFIGILLLSINGYSQTVTIEDVSGNEDDGVITLTATYIGPSFGSFTVDVSTSDGTALVSDNDYTAVTSETLNFIGFNGEQHTFVVLPTVDSNIESSEELTIGMTNVSNIFVNITDTATVTIVNDDLAGVTVDTITGTTTEAGGTTDFLFTLTSEPTADVTISISGYDATETSGFATVTFTSLNWNTGVILTITGEDDAIVDGDIADIIITGDLVSTDLNYNGLTVADLTVTNTDDDTVGVNVDTITGTTTEAGGTTDFVFTLTSEPLADVTISISGYDGTETSGLGIVTLTSINWSTGATLTIAGEDDTVVDGDIVDIIITGNTTSTDLNYNGLSVSDLTITNTDDDIVAVNVTAISNNTTEAGGTATFTVTLGSQPTADVTMALSSTKPGEGTVPATVVIPVANWNTNTVVTVTGVDDAIVDGIQSYSITTGNVTSVDADYNILDGTSIANVAANNEDDDSFIPTMVATDAAAAEATPSNQTGMVTVDLGAVNTTGAAIVVNVSRLGTSTATTADYNALPTSVSIAVGQQTGALTIVPVDDSIVEDTENLNLRIVAGTDYDLGVAATRTATVAIVNNDFQPTLVATDAVATEATPSSQTGQVTVDLGAINNTGADIVVNVSRVVSSTAVVADYNALAASVSISDGQQAGTLTVIPVDDTIVEGSENLLLSVLAGTGYTLGTPASRTATIGIVDNDTATLSIEDVTVNEDVVTGNLVFTVTLDKAVVGGTTVSYTFANGSAIGGGVDFTAVDGTLTFAGAANEEETISVAIIDDTILELSEEFTTQLGVPSNAGVGLLGTGEATGTIGDDDNCAPTPILGTNAPSANFCGVINANLNDYTNTAPPSGMLLTWSRSSNPLNVGARLTQTESENITSEGSFFGYFYDAVNDCAGGVLEIELVVNELPTIDSTTGASNCGSGILLLSATASTGASIKWFSSATGGTELAVGEAYSTVNLESTTSFYVEAEANGCASAIREEIIATIIPLSFSGTASNDIACSLASTQQPLSAIDLDSRLLGNPDIGVWSFVSGPTTLAIEADNVVSFIDQAAGDYIFRYTTTGAIAPCTNVFTDVTISVTADCTPDTIDLEVLKIVNNINTIAGENVIFTIIVNNLSPNNVQNIIIGDLLESGFEYVSSMPSRGTYDEDTSMWQISELGAMGTATLNIEVTVLSEGIYTNVAELLESFPLDDNTTNDRAEVSLNIDAPEGVDLEIIKTANSNRPLIGDTVVFTIKVKNVSDEATVNQIRVSDVILADFVYVFHTTLNGDYDITTGEWLIPELIEDEEATLEITVTVPNAGTFINTATIMGSVPRQADSNDLEGNNTSSVEVLVSLPTEADCGFVFNQFSPNGDGTNDFFKIQCIEQYPLSRLQIYDRYGNLVHAVTRYANNWEGEGDNGQVPDGTYFYILDFGDGTEVQKGWIQLIR